MTQQNAPQSTQQTEAQSTQQLHWPNMDQITKLMQSFGSALPIIVTVLQELQTVFASQPALMAARGDQRCPHQHMHSCCKKALTSQLQAVAELVHCCQCCDPNEQPQPEPQPSEDAATR